ncbi:MAG: SH3 domain-containing protein [Lachnospiraceae bacterium]|nr:SH3 domain-containing protein [Lachnospiraceae bacterium]
MMKKSFKDLLRTLILIGVFVLLFGTKANAGVEEYEYPHYVGVATATVNVREGAGVSFDKVTDASGKDVQLSTGDEVEILEVRKADDGIDWYHIYFTQKGVEYIGFSTSSYVAMDSEKIITPAPTPTPVEVEEEVEKEPEEKPEQVVKEDNNKEDKASEESEQVTEEEDDEEESGFSSWTFFWLFLLMSAICLSCIFGFKYFMKKSQGQNNNPARKAERLKQMNSQNRDPGRRPPQIRTSGNVRSTAPSEPRREVYVKRKERIDESLVPASQADIEQDNEEKRVLREKIEQLQQHDLVRHIVYGEGEVYDNSDVKLLEVRFGNDMRFLKKDQLVNKRELVVFDDEEQSISRKRRRRTSNQSNRNY